MSDHQLCSKHIRAIQHFIDAQEQRVAKLKGELEESKAHCKELEDALPGARRDAPPSELTEGDLPERLRARLMPEGMAWPRFEDGEPVRMGDTVSSGGASFPVYAVEFRKASYCAAEWVCTVKDGPEDDYDNASCGTSFRRPSPLGADGVPIRRSETVYGRSDGKAWRVVGINWGDHDFPVHAVGEHGDVRDLNPEWLTHERPTPPATASRECRDGVAPDGWERLERDIELFGRYYAGTDPDENDRERDALVARAKALAAGPDVVRPGEVV